MTPDKTTPDPTRPSDPPGSTGSTGLTGLSSAVTTHVLDAATGTPAVGVAVVLEHRDESGTWVEVARAVTDDDGRCRALGQVTGALGVHRLTFDTGAWFAAAGRSTFYPEVVVTFAVTDPSRAHHHVPLLLSPFAYSTYRGS